MRLTIDMDQIGLAGTTNNSFDEIVSSQMGLRVRLRGSHLDPLMSAMGHKQTFPYVSAMSALPPKADITEHCGHVRFVPKADSCTAALMRA